MRVHRKFIFLITFEAMIDLRDKGLKWNFRTSRSELLCVVIRALQRSSSIFESAPWIMRNHLQKALFLQDI